MRSGPTIAALLGLALACAPAGGQQEPGQRFSDEEVQALASQAAAALEAAAGITLKQPVPAVLLTSAEARERRKAYAAALPADSGATAAVDLLADFMFSETMLGRYLPDEKVLYVVSDVLERVVADGSGSVGGSDHKAAENVLFGVLAHELTHAYDDQVYGLIPRPSELKDILADPTRLASLQAQMSLLEGRATWLAELACAQAGRPPLETISLEEARRAELLAKEAGEGAAQSVGRGLVNVLGRAKLVQYASGREFARRAWAFGGEKFFAEVVAHMPLSIPELEDFERFRQRWAREKEAELEAAGDAAAAQDTGG